MSSEEKTSAFSIAISMSTIPVHDELVPPVVTRKLSILDLILLGGVSIGLIVLAVCMVSLVTGGIGEKATCYVVGTTTAANELCPSCSGYAVERKNVDLFDLVKPGERIESEQRRKRPARGGHRRAHGDISDHPRQPSHLSPPRLEPHDLDWLLDGAPDLPLGRGAFSIGIDIPGWYWALWGLDLDGSGSNTELEQLLRVVSAARQGDSGYWSGSGDGTGSGFWPGSGDWSGSGYWSGSGSGGGSWLNWRNWFGWSGSDGDDFSGYGYDDFFGWDLLDWEEALWDWARETIRKELDARDTSEEESNEWSEFADDVPDYIKDWIKELIELAKMRLVEMQNSQRNGNVVGPVVGAASSQGENTCSSFPCARVLVTYGTTHSTDQTPNYALLHYNKETGEYHPTVGSDFLFLADKNILITVMRIRVYCKPFLNLY